MCVCLYVYVDYTLMSYIFFWEISFFFPWVVACQSLKLCFFCVQGKDIMCIYNTYKHAPFLNLGARTIWYHWFINLGRVGTTLWKPVSATFFSLPPLGSANSLGQSARFLAINVQTVLDHFFMWWAVCCCYGYQGRFELTYVDAWLVEVLSMM